MKSLLCKMFSIHKSNSFLILTKYEKNIFFIVFFYKNGEKKLLHNNKTKILI